LCIGGAPHRWPDRFLARRTTAKIAMFFFAIKRFAPMRGGSRTELARCVQTIACLPPIIGDYQ
jgi:hypothetical protein